MEGIDVNDAVTGTGEKTSSSGESSSSSKDDRSAVYMRMRYGTERFGPDTRCDSCGSKAQGVWVYRRGSMDYARPLCSDKKEELEEKGFKCERWSEF